MLRGLVKDTAVYGLSSIIGRFLNWALVPLYTRILQDTGEFGIVTNLYAWTALLLIILTYGMETGFFRYVNKEPNPQQVYSTTLISIGFTSTLFVVVSLLFLNPLSELLSYPEHKDLVTMLILIVASDAFMAIPFAYLRYKKKPWRFAIIKLVFIAVNIGLNLFFLLLAPYLMQKAPRLVDWFYNPSYSVGYIFVSNLIGNIVIFLLLLPYVFTAGLHFSAQLLRRMLNYSLPILILGIAGIFNQMADKILFPMLYDDVDYARQQLGIYGACFKIAVVMVMFTQAFRYAYEPIIFNKKKGNDGVERASYALAMKYYIVSALLIYIGVMAYLDIIKVFIGQNYYAGLSVVPIVMWGELMMGVYFNLSLWYKLVDKTWWGGIISLVGCLFTVLIIVFGVPRWGFMACAWASAISNTVMVFICYVLGQRYYRVNYDWKNALFYFSVAAIIVGAIFITDSYADSLGMVRWVINTLLTLSFIALIVKKDFPLSLIFNSLKSR
ncbi:lipopolysaccharide biosynthesis protein [Porphyromonas circumdentaria]|uniref:Membrane protein involved in the export of O-antigen and teichoic acid n=1 Tax=Porphyromonas circumdentaria TaxID=29524 RepID=A0A1T4M1P1_9PORP|nr:oligosaccharide flippase family protein [Porphyromonas circumdentaria]MBB6275608.1 O-antigen/teichoic acid export membrane protein [Porphyromonas circumdentaria]SJZ60910.1 Membrane protein involved in the export of O-antigen and teichoic acid [Porphyromonas circumdentaria]